MADDAAVEACFASLPRALALVVFALLPVDQRMRCAEVCRGWRDALLEHSLWMRLDMSPKAGFARPATDALLRAAASRAGGQLHSIDVGKCPGITQKALLAALTANAGTLCELRAWMVENAAPTGFAYIETLLRAAPQLRVFNADVECESVADARRLLRNEGAFARLRLRKLRVTFCGTHTEASVLSLAADAAAHSGLVELVLEYAPLSAPAALDAVVAVALANHFCALSLYECRLSPASAPALARLLGGSALRSLCTVSNKVPLLNAAAAEVLADALLANRSIEELLLIRTALWRDPAAAATLLGAITAHCSLQMVSLFNNPIGDAQDAAGAALGALVAANAPALLELDIRGCGLQEGALGPLFDALPHNTHLRTLQLGIVTASVAFVRERLLPAVRANTALTMLLITVTGEGEGAAREAQEIVNSRAAR
jgi:hypothetical protein